MQMVRYFRLLPHRRGRRCASTVPHSSAGRIAAFNEILKIVILAAMLLGFPWTNVQAQGAQVQAQVTQDPVAVKIESSRPEPSAGTGLGIAAVIKNSSNTTVYLHESTTTLSLPPELYPNPDQSSTGFWATFPTVGGDWSKGRNGTISVKPGESYKVFWGLPTMPRILNIVPSEFWFTFFTPGDYTLSVVANYWTDSSLPEADYHTAIESTTIHVTAPQLVILFGAAIGGLVAYFIFPQARRRFIASSQTPPADPKLATAETSSSSGLTNRSRVFGSMLSKAAREASGISAALLVSIMVTILLARISETQFLIRVTVNDFWGAVAVGFLANYAGSTILSNIIAKVPGQQQPAASPQAPSGAESHVQA